MDTIIEYLPNMILKINIIKTNEHLFILILDKRGNHFYFEMLADVLDPKTVELLHEWYIYYINIINTITPIYKNNTLNYNNLLILHLKDKITLIGLKRKISLLEGQINHVLDDYHFLENK